MSEELNLEPEEGSLTDTINKLEIASGERDSLKEELDKLKSLAGELANALVNVDLWFESMKMDQHEKLVIGQTLESASENWDNLIQPPLEMEPIKKILAKVREMGLK